MYGGDTITCKTKYVFLFAVSILFVGLTFVTAVENQNSLNNNLKSSAGKISSTDANSSQKLFQVNAKSTYKKFRHKKYQRKFKRGRGDCWDNSAALYNRLSSSGVNARIIQYRTSSSPRHRSVQVLQNGAWVDFNYKGNGYARRYDATKHKPGLHVVN